MDKHSTNDRDFEDMLKQRYIPAPSSNLAERIIEASFMHKRQGRSGIDLIWRSFWDAFMLPKPAYVMAVIFAIGLFMGVYADFVTGVDSDSNALAALVFTAHDITEGDWL